MRKSCRCGCGRTFESRDARQFIHGHSPRHKYRTVVPLLVEKTCQCGCDQSFIGNGWQQFIEGHYGKLRPLLEKLKSSPCMDCGNRFPSECMDFDHRPGEKKLGEVGRFLHSRKLLLAEIAKCDLVCACCHRIRTRLRGLKS